MQKPFLLQMWSHLETQIDSAREMRVNSTNAPHFSQVTIRVNYNYQKEKGSRLELEFWPSLTKKINWLTSFIIQRNVKRKFVNKQVGKQN